MPERIEIIDLTSPSPPRRAALDVVGSDPPGQIAVSPSEHHPPGHQSFSLAKDLLCPACNQVDAQRHAQRTGQELEQIYYASGWTFVACSSHASSLCQSTELRFVGGIPRPIASAADTRRRRPLPSTFKFTWVFRRPDRTPNLPSSVDARLTERDCVCRGTDSLCPMHFKAPPESMIVEISDEEDESEVDNAEDMVEISSDNNIDNGNVESVFPSHIFTQSCPSCDDMAIWNCDCILTPKDYDSYNYPAGWTLVSCARHAKSLAISKEKKRVGGDYESVSEAARRYYQSRRQRRRQQQGREITPPETCMICLDRPCDHKADCGHHFCRICVAEWQKQSVDTALGDYLDEFPELGEHFPILKHVLQSRYMCPMPCRFLQHTKLSRRARQALRRHRLGLSVSALSARNMRGGRRRGQGARNEATEQPPGPATQSTQRATTRTQPRPTARQQPAQARRPATGAVARRTTATRR